MEAPPVERDAAAMAFPNHPIFRLLHALVFRLVRLFYVPIEVHSGERVPAGPVVFVLNHPNGLLDPVLLMLALGRPVAFLAKSTFFGNPLGAFVMQLFGALPVFRQRDQGRRGGPRDAADIATRNEATFARCRQLLRQGRALALFPEGTTHSEPQLLPLRSGAARIALSAEAEAGWTLDLRVVPVGLWYDDKTRFRSAVLVVVGEPFGLADYAERYRTEERAAVGALTGRLDAALDAVVLQAENAELLRAIPVVAAWTAPEGADLGDQHAWAARLLAAYERLHHTDPARLDDLATKARRYAALLEDLGVDDPWTLERPAPRRARLLMRLLALVLLAPLALLGAVMSYGPYRLAGPVAERVTRGEESILGTVKLIAGAVFVLLAWIAEAVAIGLIFGWMWGVGLFLVAPVAGYVALRWGELWHRLRALAAYRSLRRRRADLVGLLAERRRLLAEEIEATVAAVESQL